MRLNNNTIRVDCMHRRYLISLDLKDKDCLVVGGGSVAERKARSLLQCGARVRVVSPEIVPAIESMAQKGEIIYRAGYYQKSDLEGVFLVIGATDQEKVNRQIADDCVERNLIVNIVDDPGKGNFFVPAVVSRGDLSIAVSTAGKSPMLARRLREELEETFGPQYAEFLDMLGELRENVIKKVTNEEKKRDILESLVDDVVLGLLKEGRMDLVKERVLGAYRGSGPES